MFKNVRDVSGAEIGRRLAVGSLVVCLSSCAGGHATLQGGYLPSASQNSDTVGSASASPTPPPHIPVDANASLLPGVSGQSGSPSPHTTPTYYNGPPPSTPTPVATNETVVTEADNGRTLSLKVGWILRIVLHSTYWQFGNPSNSAVLVPLGQPVYTADQSGSCVAGQGCGTAVARFRVVGRGRSVVTASRTVCGEAVQCTANQEHYAITVSA